jgi:hypothetical protein
LFISKRLPQNPQLGAAPEGPEISIVSPRTNQVPSGARVEVAVQYRTRSWQTIDVDLGSATAGPVDLVDPHVQGLAELGIPVTSPVRCLRLADQVAQKLHASTGPAAAGRARDVLDTLSIDTLGELNYFETADAELRVLEERATHAFPPAFIMPAEWHPELETLAVELDFPVKTSAEIESASAKSFVSWVGLHWDGREGVIPFGPQSFCESNQSSLDLIWAL